MSEIQPNGVIRTAIVEDDPTVIDRLSNLLALETDIVITAVARNFTEGSKLVKAGGFDVLLCDLGLPDGSGINLIREAARLYPTIDIMVITIFADQEKVLESIKAGARGYLLKDERLEECSASIREIVRGGSPISPMIARQLLRQFQPVAAAATPDKRAELLTPRELEVLNLLSRGFSYAEIGGILSLSTQTIATYVKSIYRKMEVNSRSEAVFEASNMGLLNMGKTP